MIPKRWLQWGGGDNGNKSRPLILKGFKEKDVCILNYCESEFSVDHDFGSNKLDAINVFYDIREAISQRRIVIVIVHGGHEGYQLPSPRMKQLYRFFIDSGATVVVNHHQHCYSGYEQYHNGMIFYGLGNFFFDSKSKSTDRKWFEGYMVGLDVNDGQLESYKLYPYHQCLGGSVEIMLMDENAKKDFFIAVLELNKIIDDDELLQVSFSNFADKIKLFELVHLTPYANRVLQALYKRGLFPSFMSKKKKMQLLNMLRCESHRDICVELLSRDFR